MSNATITQTSFCPTHQARDGRNAWGEPDTCLETEVFTFVGEVEIDGTVHEANFGTYRATKVIACPECAVGRCLCDGEWATGERLLSGYTPSKGELVKNHVMKCVVCGWMQAS